MYRISSFSVCLCALIACPGDDIAGYAEQIHGGQAKENTNPGVESN
jgi:hypothetical protein